MKKYGAFSGWFKLSGTRGRLSFLFSSLITYILLSIIYLIHITVGFGFTVQAVNGNEILLSNTQYFFKTVSYLIILFNLWIITCIEVQRLRDIGLNSFIIMIVIIFGYFFWYTYILSFYQFNWALIGALIIGLFKLFMPPNRNTESKKVEVVSDSKSERIDPKL